MIEIYSTRLLKVMKTDESIYRLRRKSDDSALLDYITVHEE